MIDLTPVGPLIVYVNREDSGETRHVTTAAGARLPPPNTSCPQRPRGLSLYAATRGTFQSILCTCICEVEVVLVVLVLSVLVAVRNIFPPLLPSRFSSFTLN